MASPFHLANSWCACARVFVNGLRISIPTQTSTNPRSTETLRICGGGVKFRRANTILRERRARRPAQPPPLPIRLRCHSRLLTMSPMPCSGHVWASIRIPIWISGWTCCTIQILRLWLRLIWNLRIAPDITALAALLLRHLRRQPALIPSIFGWRMNRIWPMGATFSTMPMCRHGRSRTRTGYSRRHKRQSPARRMTFCL